VRDEQRSTNERLGHTNERLGDTNLRLERLERRQTEDATRLATELVAVAHAVVEVRDLLRTQGADRSKLDEHERRIGALEKKIA
jgi:hypothetical protein